MEFNEITIPAARGVQAGYEYYLAMLPIKSAAQLFKVDYFNLPPEERSQRVPDPNRVEDLANWISSNPLGYVLPALTGSIEGKLKFEPCEGNPRVGLLKVDLGAVWHLLDGQHRKEALRRASENEAITNDAIAVTLFIDRGLEWRQDTFAKINLYAKPPSRSLGRFYDDEPEARFTRQVVEAIPQLFDHCEKDRNALGVKSNKLFVYSWLHDAMKEIRPKQGDDKAFCIAFWQCVLEYIEPLQKAVKGEKSPYDLRKEYVCSHAVTIKALSQIGKALNESSPKELRAKLSPLKKIDWLKGNSDFENRIVSPDGKMLTKAENIKLLVIYLKTKLAIALDEREQFIG